MELECRLKAMMANWSSLRGSWFARSPWSHRRPIFLSRFVSAAMTGMDAYAASPSELSKLYKKICKYLRALTKGKAYDSNAAESHGRSWTNAQILQKWKVLPASQKNQMVAGNDGAQPRTTSKQWRRYGDSSQARYLH